MAGMVYLVGAGPGDYRLISMKAVDCLKMADVVVYDRLADDRILRWAPDDAEYIYVGKASSNHTMKQKDINQLLVDKAKEGKCVVRLKGGDPFVFGRGGEEGLLLRENNLPFEIVPGITSAISVPAYAGIPVTHRAVATSFAVVTGHEDPTKGKSNMRWEHLATGVDTLVFLMGVANLPHITSKLIENGRSADTPAAVIRWGTKPEQRTLVTTVGKAAEDVAKNGIKPPAIFIVGEVVKLRDSLQWFDNLSQRPLFGKRILVTRARSQASKLTAKLENLGAEVFEAPAISMADPADNYAALDKSIDHLQDYHWLIFTSANGVGRFFARLFKAGKDARALGYAKIAAIGSATAEKLHQYGLNADVVPAEYRAEGVLEALKGKLPPHAKILIPRAAEAREILPEKLKEMGAEVEVAAAYRTVCGQVDGEALAAEIQDGQFDMVTFTSSSTVKNLVEIIGSAELLKDVKTACIGPITADTAKSLGIEPDIVAEEYTIDGLVEAICK
ncbi:uroporphyrinogen-III C-methyltransferase [Selenomonas ruminantium]|uniref:uroporphyrinogen-III C-methyltransferase n=1 Tax=Selenomonas ruminantium TaxID=971 RepID=A0A1H0TE86_SELRU|nr:uroporphyrinogen-III C-methyltransferase [Selenomonas ruminantium]SDP52347.1 uroporphyrinogen III methyltransferase / synthase [Selenomonas ruminantium]